MTYVGFRALGAVDLGDVTIDDDGGNDPHASYVAWAADVAKAGGTVSVAPHARAELVTDPSSGAVVGGGETLTAARYPVGLVFPNAPAATLAPGFSRQPDDWSDNGQFVFYVAPAAVQAYLAPTGEVTHPQNIPGEPPPPKPQWYDDLVKYGKYAAYAGGAIVGGLLLLEVLSFVPKPRR